ncbi:MAG TPA: DUF2017 family protein [Acidimicrobiales bacterium]|nr:DUF2017 family protein [Acidimicrobiales bacterium]
MAFASPIRRRRDGRYTVRLPAEVRTMLGSLAEQMSPLIESDDPAVTRLFPPAYIGDDSTDAEKEYRKLVDGALQNHHHQALDILAETVTADTLTADQLSGWLSAIGSMRLVIGTRLDVSEDMPKPAPGDPSESEHAVFDLLGMLQATIVDVLAEELPDEGEPPRGL